DRRRPLGRITPVATSATLGSSDETTHMRAFARTVFGEEFGPDAVVTESRLAIDEWAADGIERVSARSWAPVEFTTLTGLAQLGGEHDAGDLPPAQVARAVLADMRSEERRVGEDVHTTRYVEL